MDPDTIWQAIFGQESDYGRNTKTSVTGAVGPGQIQPQTWAQYALPGERINNPADNIAVSKRIVRDYYNRFGGDPSRIATAYFSGPQNVATEGPRAFIKDKADPTGKRTSSYVSDINRRISSMDESVPDFLGGYAKTAPVPTAPPADEPAIPDFLGTFGAVQPAAEGPRASVATGLDQTAQGIAYGATHGLSGILSGLGPAGQTEGGMPISGVPNVPDTKSVFDLLQSKVTGTLPPGNALGRNIGEILPYTIMPPYGTSGPLARLIGAGLSGTGQTIGGALTEGTPYQPLGELAGGLAAPYAAGKTISALGKTAANVTGAMSGIGEMPIAKAFETGVQGGEPAKVFRASLAGDISPNQLVDEANRALTNMRIARGQQYVKSMEGIGKDQTVLSFDDIDKAMEKANKIKTFKGQQLSPETQDVQDQVNTAINKWRNLDPAEYHTPAGMDALKQRLGSIKDNLQYGTPQRKVAEDAYNSVRQTIVKQAPAYSDTMSGYEDASNQIDEIKKTLSLNPKASVDTAFRKLLSTMRNNANTNYGQRVNLVQELERNGAPNLSAALAGQTMQSWLPHGLARGAPAVEIPAAIWAAYEGGGVPALATLLSAAPLQSPKIAGLGAHSLGRLYRGLGLKGIGEPSTMAPFAFSQVNRLGGITGPQ